MKIHRVYVKKTKVILGILKCSVYIVVEVSSMAKENVRVNERNCGEEKPTISNDPFNTTCIKTDIR